MAVFDKDVQQSSVYKPAVCVALFYCVTISRFIFLAAAVSSTKTAEVTRRNCVWPP